jgi:hypothetical protein
MSESLLVNSSKEEIYRELLPQIEAVIGGTDDLIANLANVAAILKQAFKKFHWVGFYRTTAPNLLTLGPFQGPPPEEIIDKADPEAVKAFGHEVKNAGAASPEGEGNWAKSTFEDLVQCNDGFKTNLIGTPEQIARRIVHLKSIGVNLILTAFLHFQEEVEYFGRRVLPLVRALEQRGDLAEAA